MIKVAGNTMFLLVAQAVISSSVLLLSIAIARHLGDVGFGEYSLAITFVSMFAMFADLGYDVVMTREVSKDTTKAGEYLHNVNGVRLIVTLLLYILIILTINLLGYPDYIKNIVYVFGVYVLLVSLSASYKMIFRAFEMMKFESVVIIIGSLTRLVAGLTVLTLGYGLLALAFVFIISGIAELAAGLIICNWKFIRPRITLSSTFVRRTIPSALPLSLYAGMMLILVRIDTVLLSLMKGQEVVGWYNAAYNIVLATSFVPALFLTSLFPTALKASSESKTIFSILYQKSVRYLVAIAIPLSLSLMVLAQPLITVVYGEGFENSVPALQILAWDCCLTFISLALANALIGIGKERPVAICAFICIVVNVVLNIILIPSWGMIAAAVTTLASEVVLIGLYLFLFKASLGPMPLPSFTVKPVIAAVPMVLSLTLLHGNIYLIVIVSLAAYFVVFYLIGGLDRSEAELVKSYLGSFFNRLRPQ